MQPGDRHAERREPLAELAQVLLGKDLRGRHHRRLATRIQRRQAGDGGDDGLAAADVALQQALHRMRLREVAQDLRHGAALRAREQERQLAEEALEQRPVGRQRQRLARAPRPVRDAHRELLREQLVELDAPPGWTAALCERRAGQAAALRRRGQVQRAHAGREFRQVVALAHRLGQRVVEGDFLQRGQHELAQLRLRQACRGRVDRRQRLRQRLAGRDDPVARVHHLRAEETGTDFAEGAHQLRLFCRALKLAQLAAVEIQEAQHQALGVHHELPLRPVLHFGLQHARFDLHRRARGRGIDRRQTGFILVAVRQVQHQVLRRAQAELGELFLEAGAAVSEGMRTYLPGTRMRVSRRTGCSRSRRARRAAGSPRRSPRATDRACRRTAP